MTDIYINNVRVNIDDSTVISLNLVNFDIKDISNRSLNYTNAIKIPIAGNEVAFGFSSGEYTDSNIPYTDFSVQIVSGSYTLLENGRGWITSVSNGYYNISITDKSAAIQLMKEYKLDNAPDYSLGYSSISPSALWDATAGYKLDIIYSDSQIKYAELNENKYKSDWKYDNICVYVKYVFGLFSLSSGYTFAGGLWNDSEFVSLRTVIHSYSIFRSSSGQFVIQKPILSKTETFYTLFKEVLKIFCAVFRIEGKVIYIDKLDSLDWSSPSDFSGKLIKIKSKQFDINGTARNNYIKYIAESGVEENANRSNLPCNNKNLLFETDLININSSIYPFLYISQYHELVHSSMRVVHIPDNSRVYTSNNIIYSIETEKAVNNFVFLTNPGTGIPAQLLPDGFTISVAYFSGAPPTYPTEGSSGFELTEGDYGRQVAVYYNASGNYARIKSMLLNPVYYEVEMYLTPIDIQSFNPFNIISVPELGGNFYVNGIKNILLSSNNHIATLELIKV